jgi:hypothetical protein
MTGFVLSLAPTAAIRIYATGAAVLRSWSRPEPSQLIHSRSRGVDFFASPFFCPLFHNFSI